MEPKEKPSRKPLRENFLFLAFMILVAGPFALPLVFKNERLSIRSKVVIVTLVVALTFYTTLMMVDLYKQIFSYYNQVYSSLNF